MKPRILLTDIETAPNKAYIWGLWDKFVPTDRVIESGYMLCFSAKWLGDKHMMYADMRNGSKPMLLAAHSLLNDADIVVHYNGTKFDIPTLRREFIKANMKPPAPFKQLDLLRVVKRYFRFESNKLDYVSRALGLGNKARHEGFQLWVKCMEGDPKAWSVMERYNKQDVVLLEKLYLRLRPWIDQHPNMSAYQEDLACPKCGSGLIQRRGSQVALTRVYQRYQCRMCGGWFRGNGAENTRGVNIA